jgi:glycine/D-amino acid oxidase-like deaminating enzyme/nitrite reductase/ring-hydroxylating ferredoxin subunit
MVARESFAHVACVDLTPGSGCFLCATSQTFSRHAVCFRCFRIKVEQTLFGVAAMKRLGTAQNAKSDTAWSATKMPVCRRLERSVEADVCVLGGGISGLTTAYLLGQMGKSVVVLEDGTLASGMTGATTAHLSNAIDDRIAQIERWHGEEGARLAVESHGAAIDLIEETARELKIDCDFKRVDGYLFCAPEDDRSILEEELAAAVRAGLWDADLIAFAPLQEFNTGPAIRFPRQARFHPLKYLAGLARAIKAQGGKIFGHSHADHIEGGETAIIEVGKHKVTADAVVVATNTPINDLVALHTKQAPYMTYAIGARIPKGSVTDALYWDTLKAYHYIRLEPLDSKSDLLIVGGEDHKTGQADDAHQRHARLETWARARFPMIEKIESKWGGQCMETIDGLAFIGRNPLDKENVFVVTGDSGMGITHGTLAGILLTDLIMKVENPWTELYDPARKTLSAAGNFVKENANVAVQYTDWLTPGEVKSVDEIERGCGAVLRQGMSKVAAYRDDQGQLHKVSAVCPHLDCIVHWNSAETTWDCPCHGSRFDHTGKVLNGPANSDLKPVK